MAFEFDASTAKPDDGAFDPTTAKIDKPSAARRLGDVGISLAKGVIGVPEAAVGLADLVTGGQAGKAAEGLGFRPKEAKAILSDYYSPQQKAANTEVDKAEGFLPTVGAMLQNPSTILNSAVEFAPSMIGVGAISRGILKVAPKVGAIAAGAIGEGGVAAGQNAEQVRQESKDGLLTGTQSAILAASGALTGGLSLASGKLANKLGIGDIQTQLAAGKLGTIGEEAAAKAAGKGIFRKTAEGFATEGVLQELPQSYQEQVAQNLAQGKPWDEGASKAGAQGLLTGGLMGAGGNIASGFGDKGPVPTPPPIAPTTPAIGLGYNPNAGIHTVFPDGSVVLNSDLPAGEQAVFDKRFAPQPIKPSEAMGIDPMAGPLSKAAATAVDTGAHQPVMPSITGNTPAQMFGDQIAQNPLQAALQPQERVSAIPAATPEVAPSADQQAYDAHFAPENQSNSIATQAINTPATARIEAQNEPSQAATQTQAVEAGAPARVEPTGQPAARTGTGADQLETSRVGFAEKSLPKNASQADVQAMHDTVQREITTGRTSVSQPPLSPLAIIQRQKKLERLTQDLASFSQPKEVNGTQAAQTIQDQPSAPAQAASVDEQAHTAFNGDPENIANKAINTPASGTIEAVKPIPAGLAKMRAGKAAKDAESDRLFGIPEKRAKAIARIAKGTAYFSTTAKAKEFIDSNGLKDTHEFVKHASGANRWDVVAKAAQPIAAPESIKPTQAAPVQEYGAGFEPVGARAFNEGKPRLPPGELRGLKDIEKEWYAGWDKANLAAKEPVEALAEVGSVDGRAQNSQPMPTLEGFKLGDKVDVPSRTIGQSTVTRLYTTRMAGFTNPEPMATIINDAGKTLDLNLSSLVAVKIDANQGEAGVFIADAATKDVAKSDNGQDDWKVIGKNTDGKTIVEDKRGVRSYVEKGIRISEAVGIKLTRDGPQISVEHKGEFLAGDEIQNGKNDELDSEVRGYEEKAEAEKAGKLDPLNEKEKAAKAKMLGALGKLAALASKNTRMNWTQEEEQQLLPIVIELFDGAMELGAVTFQKAVRYVREFIAQGIDQETADAIPFDTLQGAYIATSGRHKDKGVTPKKEVAGFDSLAELEAVVEKVDIPAEKADTDSKVTPNDSTTTRNPPAIDPSLDEGQRPAGSESPARGAKPARARKGRPDGGDVLGSGRLFEESADGAQSVGNGSGVAGVQHGENGDVAGSVQRKSADFIPSVGGLTRQGSWFETGKRNIDLIELAIKIESEKRLATPAEQEQLSKYVGFGAGAIRNEIFPIPPAYAKSQEPNRLIWSNYVRDARWKPLAERIEALPREWQQSILQSSQYAHYTSEGIIRSVWSAIQRIGFTGGNVFEPGTGIGSFAMLMPENVRNTSKFTGVEFDSPTALIARLLSPDQNLMHADFIKRKFPKNFFDVNVGNPPFSQTKIFGDPDYEKQGFMLHDFFFAKGIDMVRPGGLQVFVTSKGTMDKLNDKARKYLSERADLLGAIRLPSTAFEDNAGTSVVTDVIFLRKRLDGEAPAGEAWANIGTVETPEGATPVNEYFVNHPEMVLGQHRLSGGVDDMGRRINSNGMGGAKYTVVSYDKTAAELDAKFATAIEKLPENAYSTLRQSDKTVKAETAKIDFDPAVKREGVIYLAKDGALMRVHSGVGKPLDAALKLSDKDKAWYTGYVGMRDLVQEARFAQVNDADWPTALKKLNKAYDAFRKEHGPINDFRVVARKSTDEDGNVVVNESRVFKNRRLYREDYDQSILTSMEDITESGEIVKAPFLLGRTIGKPVTREVKSIGDALAVSLDSNGSLNLDDVARHIKLSRDETIEALGNQIYMTPSGDWQLTDEYLSGNVVQKLEEAEQAARLKPELMRNVEALKAAQPEKLGPAQISAKLGASWVPATHVNDFSKEIGAGAVTFDNKTESWHVDGGNLRSERKAGAEYGTAQRSPSELLEAVLNSRSLKVMQTIDKKTSVDEEATTAAGEAAKKIKDKFKSWVWTDTDRATELVETYNTRFNNIAPRRFDGSHLTLPGVSLRFKLHPHQLRAIWRMVQTGNTYLAHAVGSGKTIEMIAGGMEQKRLGLIKKPMYVVPNHMLEQFSNEFMELYPLANIMVADDENFSADRRKAFIASATLNNPDAIVITHDAFQRIGVSEESVAPIRDEILADLEIELSETAKDQGARVRRSQLQQQIEAVTQRFDRIIGAGGKDSTIKFEDMGVDFVFADEAHAYRKLDFHTAQQIKGIDPNGSKRALDMYVKTRVLDRARPGRSLVFASGTPVTNTMGELYTIMRFFAQEELDRAGISTFDSWARQFGEVAPALEPNAAGKYELVERFAKFDNVPELMSRVRQFMDVLTSENLGALVKRPDLKGGKPQLNIVEATPALTSYMQGELARRIEISKKWKPSKDQPFNMDPIVAIITDGRFAALDPRFFGGALAKGEKSIITEMGDKVIAGYKAGADNVYFDKDNKPEPIKGSTQVVFYNLGFGAGAMESRGFNSRAMFTKHLIDGGIKRDHIAWFDDANSDAKKEAVFKDMRSGKLRVLIGSAKKMGTGVNVQKRLQQLHYQDPPWFPSDVEQPHGRIIRQGNQNAEVSIDWYTTKGTYQSTMWQMVGRKQRFIDQAFTGDKSLRSMDDMGEASLFEQAAAVASGDPRAIQLAGLKQDVERFQRLQAAHANEQIHVKSSLRSAEWNADSAKKRIKTYSDAFKAIGEKYYAFTSGTVGKSTYTKPGEFGQALKDAFNKQTADAVMNPVVGKEISLAKLGENIALSMDTSIGRDDKPDGTFDLYVMVGEHSIQLVNAASLGAEVDTAGLARRAFNAVNGVESSLNEAKRALVSNETDINKLRKKMGAPFEYQLEMAEKYGELKRLEAELKAEGEIVAPKVTAKINPDGTADGETRFSRGQSTTGLPATQLKSITDSIKAKWSNAPEIIIAANMDDKAIPQAVRDHNDGQLLQGAEGSPEGFLYEGKVYLVADQLATPKDVMRVLFHETLGHVGLRGVFGDSLTPILQQIAMFRKAEVAAKAKEYGLDMNIEADRLQAAEEVLAVMAQDKPDMGFVKRAIAAIRSWLRAHGVNLRLTDSDIIANYILPARAWVQSGKTSNFDASNPDIRFSRSTAASLTKTATDKLNENFSVPGKLSWWHKSFGTMNNLAERSPAFKPVFEAAQNFINDTSYYATEAADMAGKILPKLESWRDLGKSPISATDNKAISAPIFEGTLSWARDEAGKPVKLDELETRYKDLSTEEKGKMLLKKRIVTEDQLKRWLASPLDIYEGAVRNRFESAFLKAGVLWTDAELKSIFNQTPEQISLYKEFRAATDKSLDNMAKAEMLRFGGKDIAGLKDAVMDAKDADEAGLLLRDYLLGLAETDTRRKDALMETANGMIERADKVTKLKAEGYAPLSRFGKYSVDVVVDGERQYFGLHESMRDANIMAMKMKAEYGAANVSQGTLSESQFKLFAGITPESLELFGNMLGLDSTGNEAQDQAFQNYLKLTKTNRSALRRMIHRKGIAGFSEDAGRVLASFVYSNARNTAAALNMGNLGEAINDIPKEQGELKDAAISLADYIKNPQEEAQAIRGLLFAQYLGGSVASAFVNLTQPFAVTFPWLSQFGGAKQSGAQLVRAMKDMASKNTIYEADLAKALRHAEEMGIVSPQEVHQLMAQARGAGTLRSGDGTKLGDAAAKASNALSKLSLGWGKVFGMAEQLNRRSTFIAAYRIAKLQNMANPAAFAEKAVNETQFIYSKANKMKFGRGAVGGTLMTFKTYSIAYLELLHRMYTQGGPEGKKAVLLALGVMMLMSGSGGLPFEDDILDLVDGLLQKLGYNISSKKAKQQFFEDLFGRAGADFVERGISGLPGMPLDVSGRMGMGNLIPGTGLLMQKNDHTRDVAELIGPMGDMVKRGFDSAGKLLTGDVAGAALGVAPTAIRNMQKGAEMGSTGQYKDAKGYKVIETTPLEAALKSIGFQPATVAKVQDSVHLTQQSKDFYNQQAADIRARWAKGISEKDPEQVKSARDDLQAWNEKNPDQKMVANLPAIWKKVREMNKTKEQRLIDTAPKSMRLQLKRDLMESRAQ